MVEPSKTMGTKESTHIHGSFLEIQDSFSERERGEEDGGMVDMVVDALIHTKSVQDNEVEPWPVVLCLIRAVDTEKEELSHDVGWNGHRNVLLD